MISKLIIALRQNEATQDATGTFADGLFPLTTRDQSAFDKGSSLRRSYARDYKAGEMDGSSPLFA